MRKFVELVESQINTGFEAGIDMFLESLETDLSKNEVLSEHGVATYVNAMMENYFGPENDSQENIQEEEQVDPYEQEMDNLTNFLSQRWSK